MNIRDLGGAGPGKGVYDHGSDVLGLQQVLRPVGSTLEFMKSALHLRCCPTQVNAQDPDAIRVDLGAEAVGQGLEHIFVEKSYWAKSGLALMAELELMKTISPLRDRNVGSSACVSA